MARLFIAAGVAYLLVTLLAAGGALALTLWAHSTGSEALQDLVSASILHTAAACAAMGFVGGFDMFFTIWQLMRNNQLEEERRKEREEDRKAREEDRKMREEERKTREEERIALAEERVLYRRFQEEILLQLQSEREQRDLMTARVLEMTDQMVRRSNGGGNGNNAAPADRE